MSPYNYAANNPIKNIDVNGDSIYVMANLKGDNRIWDAFATLGRTAAGRSEYNKYASSNTTDIYVSNGDDGLNVPAYSMPNLRSNNAIGGWIFGDDKIAFGEQGDEGSAPFEGHDVEKSKGKEVDIMGVNWTYTKGMDKYDVAFAVYHEMKAHLSNDKGTADEQHAAFGSAYVMPGLGIHNAKGDYIYAPKSEAWNEIEQLLILKIADGNGTDQNKKDLKEMVKRQNQ